MKKSIILLVTILALGAFVADTALQGPAAYAAAQGADSADKDGAATDKQGGKADDGHSGHH